MTKPLTLLRDVRPAVDPDPELLERVRADLMSLLATAAPTPYASVVSLGPSRHRRRTAVAIATLTLLAATAATWVALHHRSQTSILCPGGEGIPSVTGDPAFDCQRIWATRHDGPPPPMRAYDNGVGGIEVRIDGDAVPDSFIELPPGRTLDPRIADLSMTLDDAGTGLPSACRSGDVASEIVRSELKRLGLVAWSVRPDPGIDGVEHCAFAAVDDAAGTVFLRGSPTGPDSVAFGGPYTMLARDIEAAVTAECIDLDVAADLVRSVGAAAHIVVQGSPVVLTEEAHGLTIQQYTEPSARCTTVNVLLGGSVLVYLRGPAPG